MKVSPASRRKTRLLFQMFSEMGLGRLGGLASGIHFAGPTPAHDDRHDAVRPHAAASARA